MVRHESEFSTVFHPECHGCQVERQGLRRKRAVDYFHNHPPEYKDHIVLPDGSVYIGYNSIYGTIAVDDNGIRLRKKER